MKKSIMLLAWLFIIVIMLGCGRNNAPGATPTPKPAASPGATNPASVTPDANASPSVALDENALIKAMGTEGTWIVILTKDVTSSRELKLEGEYTNGKKDENGKDIIQRKIALYAQDANRNITERYTLTAPKLTVTSPNASIQHGTFKGDLYVSVKDFQLIDTKVEGNVYFTTEEAQSTFKMDEQSSVTGKKELKKD